MDILLNDFEARVLGALMEKEMATPEYYPLTLNSLTNACNQKSNRHPVVFYEESTVIRALDGLKEQQLVVQSNVSRVPKYSQNLTPPRHLVPRESAVICVLLLRGPQTVGELRGRTERLYTFDDLESVRETLESLQEQGYIAELPRQPGRKENRFCQLLSGIPEIDESAELAQPEAARIVVQAENERIAELEQEMASLKQEMIDLKAAFEDFRKEFE